MLTNRGGRLDKVGVAAVPATAQPAPTTNVTTPEMPLFQNDPDLELSQEFKNTVYELVDVPTAALTVESPSAPFHGSADGLSPPPLPLGGTAPRSGDNQSEGTVIKLLKPERASKSAQLAPPTKTNAKPSPQRPNKFRGAPGISRLRAPGWGREVTITAIPPASTATGVTKAGTSSAATTALLPWDLLTPVTEAATVDEHSEVSHGTDSSKRMTPVSSVASGSRPGQGEFSVAIRRQFHHRIPHNTPANLRRQAVAGPGVYRLESPLATSDSSGGRNQHGRGKRAMWGSGTVGSGAHSAPGKSSAKPNERHSPPGGALSSSSAYRSFPLSGAGSRVAAGGFSTSGDKTPGRQTDGGYVAAMGRRARSMARCEAARRLVVAAMAADRPRPSTPISERARWGKGRESQVELERKKLLRRRAEYAEGLQRKAKVIYGALAECKLAGVPACTVQRSG